MHAEATKHVLLGRKSLGCPAAMSRSARNGLGGEQIIILLRDISLEPFCHAAVMGTSPCGFG
jgi:hypothetical protein